jgi:hypothetical protein
LLILNTFEHLLQKLDKASLRGLMTKSDTRELTGLLRHEARYGTLTPFDQLRKAELLDALIGAAVDRAGPQIAVNVERARAAQAQQAQRQQPTTQSWAQRQAAAILRQRQQARR